MEMGFAQSRVEHAQTLSDRQSPALRESESQTMTAAEIKAMAGVAPTPPGSRFFANTEDFLAFLESRPNNPDAEPLA